MDGCAYFVHSGRKKHTSFDRVFCDISDLVVHLPERILFRLNFALVGALLAAMSAPIHDVAASRVFFYFFMAHP